MHEVFEKIIEKLEECEDIMLSPKDYDCFGEECKYNDCTVCAFAKAIEIVKQAAEEYNNGWIPCSERLPVINVSEDKNVRISYREENRLIFPHDIGKRVIVTDNQGDVYESIFWINAKEFDKYSEIIAWKPLPDPYQTNGE